MCSRPVTLGGGMTITNLGDPGGPEGWKWPSASQRAYHRSSKWAGSKVFSRPFAPAVADSIIFDMKKGLSRSPFIYQKAGGLLFDARLELPDALLDHDLGDVGDHFPGDLPDNALGEPFDDARGETIDVFVRESALRARDRREHLLELADRGRLREYFDLRRHRARLGRRRGRPARRSHFGRLAGFQGRDLGGPVPRHAIRRGPARGGRVRVALGHDLGRTRERRVF